MANTKKDKNTFHKAYSFLKKNKFKLMGLIVAIVTALLAIKTNEITRTANFLQINATIQNRTDIVVAVDLKARELNMSFENSGTFDANQVALHNEERWAVVTALLNAYEFACTQYLKNKVDKEEFKAFYFDLIKYIKNEYSVYFNPNDDGTEPYSAINKVHREWHGK